MHLPNVMVKPPREFKPVTGQSPYTQNSPNSFSKSVTVGALTVTSWPSRDSQKSRPNSVGWRVALTDSTRLWLFGTERNPSGPTSKAETDCVGGLRSTPRTKGVTVWPFVPTETSLEDEGSISVPNRSPEPLVLNSLILPVTVTASPMATLFRMVDEVVNTFKPLDTLTSETASP